MNARTRLYAMALCLLAMVAGILFWPREKPSPQADGSSSNLRQAGRPTRTPVNGAARPARDFSKFAKLAAKGEFPKLSPADLDGYLRSQRRSVGSLLAAFRLSGDESYLNEARERFPGDPQVMLASLRLINDPSQRLELLERFKAANPDNGLGNCLTANVLFALGRNEEGFAELLRSSGKGLQDFTLSAGQNDEEAYLSAGIPPVEAKMAAAFNSTKPELMQIGSQLAKKLDELRQRYISAGDSGSEQSVRDIQAEMARGLQKPGPVIDTLIGLVHEKGAWKGIDSPEAEARLAEIDEQRKSLTDGARKLAALMEDPAVPESDWQLYFDRAKLFGEKAANEWMLEKHEDLR